MDEFVFKAKVVPDLSGFKAALEAEIKKLNLSATIPVAFRGATGAGEKGGGASFGALVHAERNATRAMVNFTAAVTQATRTLDGFAARTATATRAAQAAAMGPAAIALPGGGGGGGPTGPGGGKGANFLNAMMAFPGIAQVFGYARAFPSKAVQWSRGNVSLAETQQRAETQLAQILQNGIRNGKNYDSGTLGRLKAAASAEQGRSMYGDEAILGGVGELSSYVSNEATLAKMIPLLTDYAAGMTGGGAVDYRGMIDLATGLGKALDGVYDNLKKKGFDTSELEELSALEKAGGEVTDDMKVAALERALADYKGLAKAMAETPMGVMEQVKNSLGDAREEAGFLMQDALLPIFQDLREMMPDIAEAFKGMGESAAVLANGLGTLMNLAIKPLAAILKDSNRVFAVFATGAAATLKAFFSMTKSVANLTTAMNESAAAAQNAAAATSAGEVAKNVSGLQSALTSLARSSLWSILAGEISTIVSAGIRLLKQKRKEWATEEKRQSYQAVSDAFLAAKNTYLTNKKNGTNSVQDYLDYQAAALNLMEANRKRKPGEEFVQVSLTEGDRRRLGFVEETRQEGKNEGQKAKPPKIPKPVVNISADFNSVSRLVKENLTEILRSQLRVIDSYQAVNV